MYSSCPTRACLPARRVGSGDEICIINKHTVCVCICMTINEHAACTLCSGEVPVTLYSVSI